MTITMDFSKCYIRSGEAVNTNCIVFGVAQPGLEYKSTTLEESILIMTPLIQFLQSYPRNTLSYTKEIVLEE
jgi:hypothetical protein